MKQIVARILGFVLIMVIAFLAAVIIHEVGHLMLLEALGGKGEINFTYLVPMVPVAGEVDFLTLPNPVWPVYLIGGIWAAVLPWFFIWFVAWRTRERCDVWIEATSASVMLTHVFYAPIELVLYFFGYDLYVKGVYGAVLASQIIFYVLYIRVIADWVDTRFHNGLQKTGMSRS